MSSDLLPTPLHCLHLELGAKMGPFSGYDMPMQYKNLGVIQEHLNTRTACSLFDVSHMGQVILTDPDHVIEKHVPGDIKNLKTGDMRYTVLLNDKGGIIDDLMITRLDETRLYLVINASRKHVDIPLLENIGPVDVLNDRALLALQGPKAQDILSEFSDLTFMQMRQSDDLWVSRSGYTGEDGFEISLPVDKAEDFARSVLEHDGVTPAGLGARDSLRLEAGLCLYGQDLDEAITPVEAGLSWVISKRRREEGNFPGADVILRQLEKGPEVLRVGIQPEGRAPVRNGALLYNETGQEIGAVTSGTFGPSVQKPVAMGYVFTAYSDPGTSVSAQVRGQKVPCDVVDLPFIKPNYKR